MLKSYRFGNVEGANVFPVSYKHSLVDSVSPPAEPDAYCLFLRRNGVYQDDCFLPIGRWPLPPGFLCVLLGGASPSPAVTSQLSFLLLYSFSGFGELSPPPPHFPNS